MSKIDKETYFPFELIDGRGSQWDDVRLSFSAWDWFKDKYGTDTIDGYYINGYGVQGLVLASRVSAGLPAYPDDLDPNSEGDTCYLIFQDHDLAVETAQLAKKMISSRALIEKMITVARKHDLED